MAARHFWHQSVAKQWSIYKPPVVPSAGEVRQIRKWMTKKKARVLILGATPELRDLCAALKADVTLVDVSFSMMEAMTSIMKKSNPTETWVRANWLEAPLAENYFDYALGDLVILNLPIRMQEAFVKKIASWLRPRGFFITRHFIVKKKLPPAEVVKKYLKVNENALQWGMVATSANPTTAAISSTIGKRNFDRYFRSLSRATQRPLRRYHERSKWFYPNGKLWWFTPERTLLPMLRRHFTLRARLPGVGHAFIAETPTYILQKR